MRWIMTMRWWRGAALLLALLVLDGCSATRRQGSIMGALRARRLMVPVAGVYPGSIKNTFNAPRDGGARRHNALDIMAPAGTPIVSADDGHVLATRWNGKGGKVLYATDPDRRFVYFYAHLQDYHPRSVPGRQVKRGDILGYVGSTGNAKAHAPHLHFQVKIYPRNHNWPAWTPINPYGTFAQTGRVLRK
jgi:murein DD-endopeptidase MepM/ murein hydrolase activator NlpD